MMLRNYISKIVCFFTLSAFLLQPQWLEAMPSCKIHQQHHLNITKTHKVSNCIFDQDENESDEDLEYTAAELSEKTTVAFPVLTANIKDAIHFQYKDLHRLQERPIWLTCRKIVL